ncbi:MAG TPA: amidase [Alphaproteobacteria bacterium]|nr:amidase [Alphaproteobacteria bacterium]
MAILPTVRKPTIHELIEIGADFGMTLSEEDARSFQGLIAGVLPSYARCDELVEPALPVKYPRDAGYRPEPSENKYNAWYWKCEIKGKKGGVLAGTKVALKDNICLAGIPMMNGSRILEGYVPEQDASVVTRILDAGGTIAGKAACEDLCISGGSHTSALGMIKNPRKPTHSAGGSSAGSAALVAAGEIEMALGGDQGGSIRIPSAYCGVYGLKATHGLVPYTGIFPIELTLDHCGPMCDSVENVARLLSAIAGPDGLDPRQINVKTHDYLKALGKGAKGLKIAVVKEGFGRPESQAVVDQKVKAAAQRLKDAGATVKEVSAPMHLDGQHIWNLIAVQGLMMQMIKLNGFGMNWKGHYITSLADAYARSWRTRGDDFSETTKLCILLGEFLERNYHSHYYAKGQNLGRKLKAAYNAVLTDYDLLLMPTLPICATPLPKPDCTREEYVARALEMIGNTCPFDVTGHPAMSVPCGLSKEGLPVGMMLVGKHFEEPTILRAAEAFERSGNWMKM